MTSIACLSILEEGSLLCGSSWGFFHRFFFLTLLKGFFFPINMASFSSLESRMSFAVQIVKPIEAMWLWFYKSNWFALNARCSGIIAATPETATTTDERSVPSGSSTAAVFKPKGSPKSQGTPVLTSVLNSLCNRLIFELMCYLLRYLVPSSTFFCFSKLKQQVCGEVSYIQKPSFG